MKRFLILIILLLTACGEKITTCNIKTSEFEQTWKYTSKKDTVNLIELDITYDNSLFGVSYLNSLNPTEKAVLKKEILSKLGFEKNNYDGLMIDVIIDEKISIKVKTDLSKANSNLLKKIGINKEDKNINTLVNNMTSGGGICK